MGRRRVEDGCSDRGGGSGRLVEERDVLAESVELGLKEGLLVSGVYGGGGEALTLCLVEPDAGSGREDERDGLFVEGRDASAGARDGLELRAWEHLDGERARLVSNEQSAVFAVVAPKDHSDCGRWDADD